MRLKWQPAARFAKKHRVYTYDNAENWERPRHLRRRRMERIGSKHRWHLLYDFDDFSE